MVKILPVFILIPCMLWAQENSDTIPLPANPHFGTQYDYLPMFWDDRVLMEEKMMEEDNFHSSILPYRARDVEEYRSPRLNRFADTNNTNYFHRKAFYQDFISVVGPDYSFSANPILNVQLGQDRASAWQNTFLNIRGAQVKGRIGKNVSFQSTLIEGQGQFPAYQRAVFLHNYNAFAQHAPRDRPHQVLGIAPGKDFRDFGHDFRMATGEISYTPSKFFNFSLGHGNHFFGEGYRSLLLSDHAMPYGFFRIETTFWKVKYVNIYALMNNVDPVFRGSDGVYPMKYTSMHYLSWNVTKRWNVNLFETIIWSDEAGQGNGFDLNFLNPIIMYRPLEGMRGYAGGNVLIGAGSSYRLFKGLKVYSQLAVDDFQLDAFRQFGDGHWLNFFAWQFGVKYPKAFGIDGLYLLVEHNAARPFMYSHRGTPTSYTHHGLPLAHPWGASFRETLLHFNYQRKGWVFNLLYSTGPRSLDLGGPNNGADPLRSYSRGEDNPFLQTDPLGYFIGQNGAFTLHMLQFRAGYIVNAATGMRLEAGMTIRRETNVDLGDDYTPYPANAFFFGLNIPFGNMYTDF
ncbi:MAG: capsule assembly Wzi family protein [Cryomorphaceae bacterium]|nr:capsule assembly Wzi family protein [Cryomorphaceae bacterium]